jgi:hypothetical protein
MHKQLLAWPNLLGSSPQVKHICTYAAPPRHALLRAERPSKLMRPCWLPAVTNHVGVGGNMLESRHGVMTRNKRPFRVGRAIVTPRALWVLDPSVGESIELGLVSRNYDGFAKLQGRGV